MVLIYDIGIRIYYLLIRIAAWWNSKARNWINGRKNWKKDLEGVFNSGDRVIWFHCSSLGEFEQGRPIIEKIRNDHSQYKILLSFFSPSGYMKRKDFKAADAVIYMPLDTSRNAKKILELVPVEMAFFVKYDFWYHVLKELNSKRIPVYLASGNFRPDQLFFRRYGIWYRKFLGFFSHIFVQNEKSAALLSNMGLTRVSVAGDTRFDRVIKIAGTSSEIEGLGSFGIGKHVIVAGSTWEKDEELLIPLIRSLGNGFHWIIAPHEPSLKRISCLETELKDCIKLSTVLAGRKPENQVVLVDTIGHLSSLYRYATIGYIGGGFGKGIHNILEAAAFGRPILFGPNYHRFPEAVDLLSEGAAYVVEHAADAAELIKGIVNNISALDKTSQIAEKYVINNAGATDEIVDFVFKKQG